VESVRFRLLLDTPGPFVSVYFEDSHDTHDADAQLERKWRGLREQLEEQGIDESVTAEIGQAIMELRPPIGRSGRAVVAGATGVVVNEHLLRPTAETVVRVSELPYIVPILEQGFDSSDYLLVVVDHTGADISVHTDVSQRSETVGGGGYPAHKASGAETAGYGDPQLRTEAARNNARAVADRVRELVDETGAGVVFVVGEVSSRSDLLAALPERVLGLAVPLQIGARHSGHGFDEVQQVIEGWFLKRRHVMDDAAERFGAELGRQSGRAAEGLGGVCSALRQGPSTH
jgi:peptide chain release factor subunit 1